MKRVSVLMVGIGGFGASNVNDLFTLADTEDIDIVGAVDVAYESSYVTDELVKRNIPCYRTMEEFYKEHTADLAVISTPIYLHKEHTIYAMEHGTNCHCEKPSAPTLAEINDMMEVAKKTDKLLNISFQLVYTPPVQEVKKRILDKEFGKILRASAICCWPRTLDYYKRVWAGKIEHNGVLCLDSVAMNACAHYMHILFYMMGKTQTTSATPKKMSAITLRANDIETFDTAMVEIETDNAPVSYLVTHSSERLLNPIVKIECEKAKIEIYNNMPEKLVVINYADGRVETIPGDKSSFRRKFINSFNCVRGTETPICDISATIPHILTVDALTELVKPVTELDKELVDNCVRVKGIDDILIKSYEENKMPWELTDMFGAPTIVDLSEYKGWGE